MAYNEFLADRIRQLKEKQVLFTELKMMGCLCFKVDSKVLTVINNCLTYSYLQPNGIK